MNSTILNEKSVMIRKLKFKSNLQGSSRTWLTIVSFCLDKTSLVIILMLTQPKNQFKRLEFTELELLSYSRLFSKLFKRLKMAKRWLAIFWKQKWLTLCYTLSKTSHSAISQVNKQLKFFMFWESHLIKKMLLLWRLSFKLN